jgi:hypothetical protein
MTGKEILEYARGHDWTWCIYQGDPSRDCHGRICKCVACDVEAHRWRNEQAEETMEFWDWVKDKINNEEIKHPDHLRVSLLDWCLKDKELQPIWQRILEEEATARFAEARITAYEVGLNGQVAAGVIKAKIKAEKRAIRLARRRARYYQKKADQIMQKMLDQPLKSVSSNLEIGKDFSPEEIIRRHAERIQVETEERRTDMYE